MLSHPWKKSNGRLCRNGTKLPLLQGELFLFLDVHGTAEIGDYQLTYTKEWGLEYRRKEL